MTVITASPVNDHVLVRDAHGDERWVDRTEIRGTVPDGPTDWWAA